MSYKILTVDDSRTIRLIVKKAFEPYNCELFEAENGKKGLAAAQDLMPDLIVLDITMPVMNGIEMLTQLKASDQLKDTPVIMLSAESGKDHVMQIVKMGVKDYIVKPFRGDQLIDRASKVLDLVKDGESAATHKKANPNDFVIDEGDMVILTFPAKITRSVGAQIDSAIKRKIKEMIASEANRMIIDLSKVKDVNMVAIQVLISLANNCIRNKISARIVAGDLQAKALKDFQETSQYPTQPSIEHARAAF
ncbi:MAG: response regulator [Desulfobacteraceae bacterium]|jgi:DNA-binding response OmpR family regulator